MKNNKCQAYTKKRMPCRNNAMEGSYFCSFHEGLFEDFPPVKIAALMCPYCDEPLEREAKFCKTCRNPLLLCPYCDAPLARNAKSCRFCREGLTPVIPKHDKLYYYGKVLSTCRGIVEKAKAIDMGYGLFMIIIFFILLLVLIFFFTDVYFELTNY